MWICFQTIYWYTQPGGRININLKFNVHKRITYHSRCTGKRWEPISTCPAPFNIQAYAFSSSLPALFLVISSFYFFNKSNAMTERGAYKSLSLSSLSFFQPFTLGRRWRGGLKLLSCCWLSPGTAGDSIWSTTVRLLFLGLTAPLRTGPQCSSPPVSERCSSWIMRELGSVRSGPGELCRCCCRCCWVRGWRRIR